MYEAFLLLQPCGTDGKTSRDGAELIGAEGGDCGGAGRHFVLYCVYNSRAGPLWDFGSWAGLRLEPARTADAPRNMTRQWLYDSENLMSPVQVCGLRRILRRFSGPQEGPGGASRAQERPGSMQKAVLERWSE